MTAYKLIVLLPFFTGLYLFTQAQDKDSVIRRIRQVTETINTDKTLKKVVLSAEEYLDDVPDGGAELTGYFRGNSIVKISEWIGLSYGIKTFDYYFQKDLPVFIYETEKRFGHTKSVIEYNKQTLSYEGRYYFSNTHLIEQKLKGKKAFNDSTDPSGLLKEYKQYKILLQKKKNAVKK